MDFDPVAQVDIAIENSVRVDHRLLADVAAIAHDDPRIQGGTILDDRFIPDVGERIDRHVLADHGRRRRPRPRGWIPDPPRFLGRAEVAADGEKGRHGSSTSMTGRLGSRGWCFEVRSDDRG